MPIDKRDLASAQMGEAPTLAATSGGFRGCVSFENQERRAVENFTYLVERTSCAKRTLLLQ